MGMDSQDKVRVRNPTLVYPFKPKCGWGSWWILWHLVSKNLSLKIYPDSELSCPVCSVWPNKAPGRWTKWWIHFRSRQSHPLKILQWIFHHQPLSQVEHIFSALVVFQGIKDAILTTEKLPKWCKLHKHYDPPSLGWSASQCIAKHGLHAITTPPELMQTCCWYWDQLYGHLTVLVRTIQTDDLLEDPKVLHLKILMLHMIELIRCRTQDTQGSEWSRRMVRRYLRVKGYDFESGEDSKGLPQFQDDVQVLGFNSELFMGCNLYV